MKLRLFFCFSATIFVLAMSCTIPLTESEIVKLAPKPTFPTFKLEFEKSDVIQIEKSIQGLEVVASLKSAINREQRIIVVSMEKSDSDDSLAGHLVADNIITNLVEQKYNVLERDEDLVSKLLWESTSDELSTTSENANSNILSADKILSYRVLECGTLLEPTKNSTYRAYRKVGSKEIPYLGDDALDYIRYARTKLHIRVIDAKTGKIELATILENEVEDTIPRGLATALSEMHFTYQGYNLPNLAGDATDSSKNVYVAP